MMLYYYESLIPKILLLVIQMIEIILIDSDNARRVFQVLF